MQIQKSIKLNMSKKYTNKHEWVEQVEGNIWRVGISDYAQDQLGDIVVVELPEVGDKITLGKDCAVIESVKAASDIYAPLSGEIHKINDALEGEPALVNQEPEGKGWLLEIKISDESEMKDLMNEEDYKTFVEGL